MRCSNHPAGRRGQEHEKRYNMLLFTAVQHSEHNNMTATPATEKQQQATYHCQPARVQAARRCRRPHPTRRPPRRCAPATPYRLAGAAGCGRLSRPVRVALPLRSAGRRAATAAPSCRRCCRRLAAAACPRPPASSAASPPPPGPAGGVRGPSGALWRASQSGTAQALAEVLRSPRD